MIELYCREPSKVGLAKKKQKHLLVAIAIYQLVAIKIVQNFNFQPIQEIDLDTYVGRLYLIARRRK